MHHARGGLAERSKLGKCSSSNQALAEVASKSGWQRERKQEEEREEEEDLEEDLEEEEEEEYTCT